MNKRIIMLLCALLFTLCIVACNNDADESENGEKITWNDMELGEKLPMFKDAFGNISVDLANALSVELYNVTKNQFEAYKDECIAIGYTIEGEETSTTYVAFNNDGYQVRLVYSNEELSIHLEAPEKMVEFEWPADGLGAMLPATNSLFGAVCWDNSEMYIVHVGNTTIDDYKDYVKVCEEKGFTVDYSKDDEYYSAKNADGYKLTLRYLGFNRIEVSLNAPDNSYSDNNTTSNEESTLSTETSNNSDSVEGIGKDFKEAMDSYEKFMDEYIEFIKKYNDNQSDLNLIADYVDYVSKYDEFVQGFEKWEDEEMNAEEVAYYIKVQERVNKKLLEVTE